jgi:hypothetical protein
MNSRRNPLATGAPGAGQGGRAAGVFRYFWFGNEVM